MTTQAKAKLASSITFIVLASFTIVTYDRQNMFIIQASGVILFFIVMLSVVLPDIIRLSVAALKKVTKSRCLSYKTLFASSLTQTHTKLECFSTDKL